MGNEKSPAKHLSRGVQLPLIPCGMRVQGSKRSSSANEGASTVPVEGNEIDSGKVSLMMKVVADENIWKAIKRVKQNKGAPGVDSMSVDEIDTHFSEHWQSMRGRLLAGTYVPAAILRVEIPKPGKKVLLRAAPFLRSYRTSCWMIWIRNWKDEGTGLCDTQTTVMSTYVQIRPQAEYLNRSADS